MQQTPLAALAGYRNGFAFKPDDRGVEGLPIVRIEQLLNPSVEPDLFAGEAPAANRIADGDLVFSWSGTLAVRLWNRGPAYLNQHLFRVDPRPGVNKQWLRWALEEAIGRMKPLMHGTAMTHITRRVLEETRVPLPPVEQQRRIADYLDTETARIDATLAANKRIEALLAERLDAARSSLFWPRASSPLHDGEGISKIQYVTLARTGGKTPSRSEQRYWGAEDDSGIPWLAIADMTAASGEVRQSAERVSVAAVSELPLRVVPPGTLLYAMYASLGKVARLGIHATHNQAILSLLPDERLIDPDYLLEWLRFLEPFVRSEARSNTQPNLSGEQVGRLPVLVPPRSRQLQMVKVLNEEREHVRAVQRTLGRQNALLLERRRSVITAAVTGELEV